MPSININHVVLTGRLTSDPDLRALPSGSSVCHLRVAVNARRRNPDGEWGEKPNFFNVVVFGAPGENVAKYMHKGRAVAIDGRLDWREWETPDGRNAQAVSVIANTVQFLDSPPSGGGASGEAAGALHGIAGGEEEALATEDQDAIAAVAAIG
jgi:single-strand DNA-binding protein